MEGKGGGRSGLGLEEEGGKRECGLIRPRWFEEQDPALSSTQKKRRKHLQDGRQVWVLMLKPQNVNAEHLSNESTPKISTGCCTTLVN